MSKIRLVVCDIDDTLVHKELHLAENTREVIRELKDAGVMFPSGPVSPLLLCPVF